MVNDTFDFDAWWAENNPTGITYTLLGKTWDLPPDVPAAVILQMQRVDRAVAQLQAGDITELPDDLAQALEGSSVESLARQLAGDEAVDAWLAEGIGYRLLSAVVRRLYRIHSGGVTADDQGSDDGATGEGDEAGKAPTP
jgi:hypothetical protein